MFLGVASVFMYDEGSGNSVSRDTLMIIVLSCFSGLVVAFVAVLYSVDQYYVKTFLDTRSGNQYLVEKFRNGEKVWQKFAVFEDHESKWRHIIGDEVKRWVGEKLLDWHVNAPGWFTDEKKAMIPDWAVDE